MTNLPSPAALVTAALSALIAAAGLLALQILLGLEYSRPVVSDHREQPEIILRAADHVLLLRGDLVRTSGRHDREPKRGRPPGHLLEREAAQNGDLERDEQADGGPAQTIHHHFLHLSGHSSGPTCSRNSASATNSSGGSPVRAQMRCSVEGLRFNARARCAVVPWPPSRASKRASSTRPGEGFLGAMLPKERNSHRISIKKMRIAPVSLDIQCHLHYYGQCYPPKE